MIRWHHIKQSTSLVLTVLLLVASLAALYALSQGAKFLSVQSGSMVPTYHKGDLVVDMRVPAQHLAVGDVVTYTNPQLFNGEPITHRIIQTPSDQNDQQFVTKGDANPAADPPIKGRNIAGKVGFSVPLLGFLFDFVRQPLGLLILIYVPALTVIVAEIRRLMKYYQEQEPYVATGFEPQGPAKTSSATGAVMKAAAIGVAITALIVPVAQAALMNNVSLTGTTLQTAPQTPTPPTPPDTTPTTPNHLLISKVTLSSGTAANGNTTTNNTNNVHVTTNTSQTATTGNATATGSGNATSGNATNTSNTNVNINVSNSGSNSSNTATPTGTTQSVTLFNPTNQPVNLVNWQLADNGTVQVISSGTIPANGTFVFTWPVTNGLSNVGDHLILRNSSAAGVDSLSWGSDTTQLNPSVATANTTISISRKSTAVDTDTANDWQAAP